MKNKEKQIKEMPICVNCIHAYVCEEYNLYRGTLRKRCAYHNDHFLDIEQYKKQVCKETVKEILQKVKEKALSHCITINCYELKFIEETIDELLEEYVK